MSTRAAADCISPRRASSETAAPTEIVQAGPSHMSSSHYLDVVNDGCMYRESALYADAIGHASHCYHLVEAGATTADDNALEGLYARPHFLAGRLGNLHMHSDAVPGAKFRNIVTHVSGFYLCDQW